MKRLLIFPLFLALVYSIENTSLPLIDYDYEEQEVTCECNNAQLLKTADFTLREDVKNVQIRLIEPVRNTIAFAMSEKAHLLAVTKYAVLRDIDKNHPNLLRCSNFSNSFDDFMDAVKKIMNSENNLSLLTIQNEVNDSVDAFFREILPSAFLSLYSPRCRRVTEEYKACMNNNTDEWKGYFGEHPNRMATLISDTVFRYRKLEFIVSDMHDQLMNAPNLTVTSECADAYSKLVPCNCTFPGITNCNNSCPDIMETCFGKFTREWGGRLFLLQNMTRGHSENLFVNQFLKAKKSMGKSLDFLVERQVPFYAAHIVEHCGTPGDLWLLNKNPKINLVAPQRFTSQGEAAAKELQQSIKTWEKLSQQICEQHNSIAQPSYCWNGTNVIWIDADMPQLTKDVRPRPMIDWMEKRTKQKSDKNAKSQPEIESSGSPLWDDEDGYEEGSGSGLPPIIDNRPNIQFTKDHPKNIDLSITHSRGPSVVVNDFETIPQRPDSASSLGFMITIIVTFYMFFF